MTENAEFDFWNEDHGMLRPTPCLKFKIIIEPQPHLGENIGKQVRALHQMFKKASGVEIWLPVEMEED